MNFLRPEFLWALPLVAAPILIHLFHRQRFQRVEFAAMEFLRRAQRRVRRRLFLEDLLLLLLRTLAVLFLILGLAHPGGPAGGLLGGRAARGEVLVLDASLSMRHRTHGRSAFERAQAQGGTRLRELDPARGDRAALVRAGARAQRVAFGDPDEVAAALEDTEAGYARPALAEALGIAAQSAASLSSEGCETVRVDVYSDLQASDWDLEGALGEALRKLAAEGFVLRVHDSGGSDRGNTAITGLALDPARPAPGEPVQATVRIRSYGGPTRSLRATLSLDGAPLATEELELEGGRETTWSVPLSSAEAGERSLVATIDGDGLAADDTLSRVLPVRPAPRVLLIGDDPPAPGTQTRPGVRSLLEAFLDLGEGAPVRLERSSLGQLDSVRVEGADVLVLADPSALSAAQGELLARGCGSGRGLLAALGPRFRPDQFGLLMEALEKAPLVLSALPYDASQDPAGSARLQILDRHYPPLSLFTDPRWQPFLTEVPFTRFRRLRLDPDPEQRLRVPLAFVGSNGEGQGNALGPALVEFPYGAGRVAVLAAAPCADWNRMAEVPGGTLPFLLDLLAHLAPRPGHPLRVEVGKALAVELPRAPTEVRLIDPRGRQLRPQEGPTLLPGGRARVPLLDQALLPGIWTARAVLLETSGEERESVERIAVVPPASESDLTPIPRPLLAAALPPGALAENAPAAGVATPPQERPETDSSTLLYLLVALALAAETLLAGSLDRKRG